MALINGILNYYKLDETSGVVVDATGNDDGVNNGATVNQTTTLPFGKCYSFDGSNDYIDSISISTTDISYSFWIKPTVDSSYNTIIDTGDLLCSVRGPTDTMMVNIQGTGTEAISTTVLSSGTWYHIVVTINSSGTRFYVNASDTDGLLTGLKSSDFTSGTTFIGKYNAGQNFPGLIDEVGIWNRVLTASEVTELYNSGSGLAYPFSTGTNLQLNIGDDWKSVDGMQINIGDNWKTVAGAQINIGDAWKTIF